MSDRLRLALVQVDFSVGAVDDNLRRILSLHAETCDADLIVLPEGALSGYPLQDLVLRPAFVACVETALEALAARVHGSRMAVLAGLSIRSLGLPHNAAVLLAVNGFSFEAGKADCRVSSSSRACVRLASRWPISTPVGRRTRSSLTAPSSCSTLPRRHPDARRPSPKPSCVSISYAVPRGSP